MGCVRKRGKSWNAQVRIAGWRSFTKTFNKKVDAVTWSKILEDKLKSVPIPDNNIDNLKLKDFLNRYSKESEIMDEDFDLIPTTVFEQQPSKSDPKKVGFSTCFSIKFC